jgi:hypothetical protein
MHPNPVLSDLYLLKPERQECNKWLRCSCFFVVPDEGIETSTFGLQNPGPTFPIKGLVSRSPQAIGTCSTLASRSIPLYNSPAGPKLDPKPEPRRHGHKEAERTIDPEPAEGRLA